MPKLIPLFTKLNKALWAAKTKAQLFMKRSGTDSVTADTFAPDLKLIVDEDRRCALPLDLFMCYRLLLGRRPEFQTKDEFQAAVEMSELKSVVYNFLRSEEFRNHWETAGIQLPEVPVMADLNGLKLWFYLSDRVVGWSAVQGSYEPELVSAIRNYLKPDMVCCDLGANIGYFSLLMAQMGARVYSAEPFPKNFDLLQKNVLTNGYGARIKSFRAAILDNTGRASLSVDANESDYVSMFVSRVEGGSGGFRQFTIDALKLDDVVPEAEKVECIKMDVEGAEPRAVAGMTRILMRDRPRIFFEFNPYCIERHSGVAPVQLLKALSEYGYRITSLDGRQWTYDGTYKVTNLVALP